MRTENHNIFHGDRNWTMVLQTDIIFKLSLGRRLSSESSRNKIQVNIRYRGTLEIFGQGRQLCYDITAAQGSWPSK